MIYYFTPNSGDKNLGKACNDHCGIVPNDEDWICLMDHDAMFLHPHTARLIEDAVHEHGGKYQLFSCYTNRLRIEHQLPHGFDRDGDVLENIEIAKEHYERYYTEVEDCNKGVAGLFLLFQKKTWNRVKFEEGIVGVDWKFSTQILKTGGRIGILKGVFIYHLYRMGKKVSNIDHLR